MQCRILTTLDIMSACVYRIPLLPLHALNKGSSQPGAHSMLRAMREGCEEAG